MIDSTVHVEFFSMVVRVDWTVQPGEVPSSRIYVEAFPRHLGLSLLIRV